MADKNILKSRRSERRRRRVRGKVAGTAGIPRLTVARSLKNIYVQIVDDEKMITLVAAASNTKELRPELEKLKSKIDVAAKVGEAIAEAAKAKGIETVVFDRNRFRFQGRVKAVADGARKGGLKF
jgi:large subunit ribosomal protein L18